VQRSKGDADEISRLAAENARLLAANQRLQAEIARLQEAARQQQEEAQRRIRELEGARDGFGPLQEEQILGAERRRIARDLHDSVAQLLTSIALNLEWCRQQLPPSSPVYERLQRLRQLARNGIYELRNTIFDLSAADTPEWELVPILAQITAEFQRVTGIETRFATTGELCKLPLPVQSSLYRVTREALYNAFRHAQATRVTVELAFGAREIRLQITDNGVGIPDSALHRGPEGLTFGLKSMLSRLQEVGGSFEITSLATAGHGPGTRIVACVPLQEVAHGTHAHSAGG